MGATWSGDGQQLQSKTLLRKFFITGMSVGQLKPTGGCVLPATVPSCLPQGWVPAESRGRDGSIQELSGFPSG